MSENGRYVVVADRSKLGFIGRGAWGLHRVPGRFETVSGEITLAGDRLSAEGTADAASITTGLKLRDWHLRSREYLAALRHPTIQLRVDDASIDAGVADVVVTVRGIEATVRCELELEPTASAELLLRARGELDRSPYGMRSPLFGTGRVIQLDLDVTAVRT